MVASIGRSPVFCGACATNEGVPTSDRATIAFDVTPLLGARTGIGYAVHEMFTALCALDAAPMLVPYTLSARARLHRDDVPAGTHFVPLPARLLLASWARADVPRIDRWLEPARVVHATNYLAPPSRLPTLVSVYDCSFIRYPELCTPEVRAFEPIIRRAIARGATVHTGSEFVAGEIDEIFGPHLRASGRLVVIPLGVPRVEIDDAGGVFDSSADAAVGPSVPPPFVLAIGTLEPRKNHIFLVSAFGAIAERHPDLRLVIVGNDGPARPEIDAAIARLPVSVRDRVVLPGPVSDAVKRDLFAHASMLAYPSIYEGFGFPVLEAMTAGVPVVAARAGSIPEVAGDAALLVEPTDEDDLAAAMERLLTDEGLRRELVARGRDRVREFSWEDTALALSACYRRLAEVPA
jgi:glycosyltransferase involved in cell wall biosynthesis